MHRVRRLPALLALLIALVPAAAQPVAADDVVPNFPTLTYAQQPGAAVGGVPFTIQPVVHDVDAGGSPRANEGVTIGIAPGTGTLDATISCNVMTLLTDASGNASFTDCFIDKAGTGYRLSAQVLAVSPQAFFSSPFTVAVGSATRLSFVNQPIEAFEGRPFDLAVGITDPGRNVVTSGASATITLSLGQDVSDDVGLACAGGLSRPTLTSGPGAGTVSFAGCVLTDPNPDGESVGLDATASAVSGVSDLAATESVGITLQPGTSAPLPGLTLASSATAITWGQPVTFTIDFTGRAGRLVAIERSIDGHGWTRIGSITTDMSGHGSLSYRPRTTGLYRAAFAGSVSDPGGVSEAGHVVVRLYAAQTPAHAASTVLARGTTVTFSTTVRPVGPDVGTLHVSFLVYRRVGSLWHLTATRTVTPNSGGIARLAWRFASTGEFYVRSKAVGTSARRSRRPGCERRQPPDLARALLGAVEAPGACPQPPAGMRPAGMVSAEDRAWNAMTRWMCSCITRSAVSPSPVRMASTIARCSWASIPASPGSSVERTRIVRSKGASVSRKRPRNTESAPSRIAWWKAFVASATASGPCCRGRALPGRRARARVPACRPGTSSRPRDGRRGLRGAPGWRGSPRAG